MKKHKNALKKKAIAEHAARELVKPGQVICLEGGTTVAGLVEFLEYDNLTLLTNSFEVCHEVAGKGSDINLMISGGLFRGTSETFIGPAAIDFFEKHSFDTLFLSATGLSVKDGLTDPNPLESQVKQAMAKSAGKVVVLMDSTKFGVRSLMSVLSIKDIDVVVTDDNVPEEIVKEMRDAGVSVLVGGQSK